MTGDQGADCATRKQAEQAEEEEEGLKDSERVGEFEDFIARISTLIPAGKSLQATVILLVDRVGKTKESTAFLTFLQ